MGCATRRCLDEMIQHYQIGILVASIGKVCTITHFTPFIRPTLTQYNAERVTFLTNEFFIRLWALFQGAHYHERVYTVID